MVGQHIAVELSFLDWRKDPDYVAAYDELADEFALAAALIEARAAPRITEQQAPEA